MILVTSNPSNSGGQSRRTEFKITSATQEDQVPIIVTPKINTGRLEEKKSKLTRDTNVNYQYGPS